MRVVEKYYSVKELCFVLGFCAKTIREWIRAGEFSPPGPDGVKDLSNILVIGADIRVPASGVLYFTSRHVVKNNSLGIPARNKGELRRKLAKVS